MPRPKKVLPPRAPKRGPRDHRPACPDRAKDVCEGFRAWSNDVRDWANGEVRDAILAVEDCFGCDCLDRYPVPRLRVIPAHGCTNDARAVCKVLVGWATDAIAWARAVTDWIGCAQGCSGCTQCQVHLTAVRKLVKQLGLPGVKGCTTGDARAICQAFSAWAAAFVDWGDAVADWLNCAQLCGDCGSGPGPVTKPPEPPFS